MKTILKNKDVQLSLRVVILEYPRNEEWLLTAPEFHGLHRALADARFDPELQSGAKCFVSVAEFQACMASLDVEQCMPSNV